MPKLDVSFGSPTDFCTVFVLENESEIIIYEFSCVIVYALIPFMGFAGVDQPGLFGLAALIADAVEVGFISGDFDVDGLNDTLNT